MLTDTISNVPPHCLLNNLRNQGKFCPSFILIIILVDLPKLSLNERQNNESKLSCKSMIDVL